VGLISDGAWQDFLLKQARAEKLTAFLEKTRVSTEMLEKIASAQETRLAAAKAAARDGDEQEAEQSGESQVSRTETNSLGSAPGASLAQLLKRPEIVIEDLAQVIAESMPEYFAEIASLSDEKTAENELSMAAKHKVPPAYSHPNRAKSGTIGAPGSHADENACSLNGRRDDGSDGNVLSSAARNEMKTVETEIKYAGYLDQQRKSMERLKKAEQRVIPEWFDYGKVSGLSREMNEKLQRVRPRTLGQASRIPGVTPAAISLVNVYIEIQGRRFAQSSPLQV
jgi:tRNA U34 5-carboxymethylaminomethyl modifying enzyme MnmG/GidA